MKKIGYLRVSTNEQRPDRQIDGLHTLCDELHIEKLSAVSKERPVFDKVLSLLTPGDHFVVWDFDRAFRSTKDAIDTAEALRARGIAFQVATLAMDTETPMGEFTYTVIAASAHFERRILAKRTREGMAAAKRRGVRLGRPPKLTNQQIAEIGQLMQAKPTSLEELAQKYGVSRWTIERAMAKWSQAKHRRL
jgi:DNA invertase Pin-like site-specific DNA recombinase